MKSQNYNQLKNTNKDVSNSRFEALSEAFKQLNQGKNATFNVDTQLNRGDKFLTTFTFPMQLPDIPLKVANHKKWFEILASTPHLFRKHKVLYITKGTINFGKLADLLYQHNFDKKSVQQKNLTGFGFLKHVTSKRLFFQEYRFNYTRYYVESLKAFAQKGGTIQFVSNKNPEKTVFKKAVVLPVKTFPGFECVVQEDKFIIRFSEENNKLTATSANNQLNPETIINIAGKYFLFQPEKVEINYTKAPPRVDDLYAIAGHAGNFACAFNQTNLDDYYELSLEKYDLAKQTGISYDDFKIVFHRYGTGIDEMTEFAFGQLTETRDPAKIWRKTEEMYHVKYEWKTPGN